VTDNTNQTNTESMEVDAKLLAKVLDMRANRLSMRTLKQLEDARMRAVRLHEQKTAGIVNTGTGTLGRLFYWAEHHRTFVTGMILTILVASLIVIQLNSYKVDTDAMLLGSELPPEAFVDRGFEPSLNQRVNFDEPEQVTSIKV